MAARRLDQHKTQKKQKKIINKKSKAYYALFRFFFKFIISLLCLVLLWRVQLINYVCSTLVREHWSLDSTAHYVRR